jgi:hypothetical protein
MVIPEYGELSKPTTLLYRDPITIIETLLSSPPLGKSMQFHPKKSWSDGSKTNRIYSEMWTGDWWWRTQVSFSH